ncbi:hypothetical protein [Streptomyces sp. NPDC005435]|uniref:hypothetical protein n=1 Tax=Streptomyces sp. NPDC005435 TaxID=3154464 RepID=UPI00345432E7
MAGTGRTPGPGPAPGAARPIACLLAGLTGSGKTTYAKRLVEDAGGRRRLLCFPVPRAEPLRRLAHRNSRTDANALTVTASAPADFHARFDVPEGEGEEIIEPGSFGPPRRTHPC